MEWNGELARWLSYGATGLRGLCIGCLPCPAWPALQTGFCLATFPYHPCPQDFDGDNKTDHAFCMPMHDKLGSSYIGWVWKGSTTLCTPCWPTYISPALQRIACMLRFWLELRKKQTQHGSLSQASSVVPTLLCSHGLHGRRWIYLGILSSITLTQGQPQGFLIEPLTLEPLVGGRVCSCHMLEAPLVLHATLDALHTCKEEHRGSQFIFPVSFIAHDRRSTRPPATWRRPSTETYFPSQRLKS